MGSKMPATILLKANQRYPAVVREWNTDAYNAELYSYAY